MNGEATHDMRRPGTIFRMQDLARPVGRWLDVGCQGFSSGMSTGMSEGETLWR